MTEGTGRPSGTGSPDRAEALARVRSLLADLGAEPDEVEAAVADDTVDLLMVDRMLVPTGHRMTPNQIADRTGIPLELIRRIWRALGFLDLADDDPVFTDLDVEALELFGSMMAMGLVDLDSSLQMARVIGSSMARIAEAETTPGSTPIVVPTGDSVIDADQFARSAAASLPAMGRILEYVWRRHLQVATRRAMLLRARGSEEGISPVMAVGFADMVGYTVLSQHLGDQELAEVVSRFEQLAHDIVTGLGGRVVKMIGDEAMFVVPEVADAANIGLALSEAYADDDLLSDVRVALAIGPVLVQDGDYYGPVVNLASRLVGIAHPGTVLISDEVHAALEASVPGQFDCRSLRVRTVKGIGRVHVWKLARSGSAPGADRHRTARWERLGDVLGDLDGLRERSGHAIASGARRTVRAGARGSGEPERGDPVAPKLEPSLERDERTTP